MIAIGTLRPLANQLAFHRTRLAAVREALEQVASLDDTELVDAAREALAAMAALETHCETVIDLLNGRIETARARR